MTSPDHILTAVNRFDALFRESDIGNYYLSIQTGDTGFSFCVLDGTTQKYIGIGDLKLPATKGPGSREIRLSFEAFLSRVLVSVPYLQKPFKSCRIIWEGNKSTLVPNTLFEESAKERFLSFNQPVDPHEIVLLDPLRDHQAVNVFAVPEQANRLLLKHFPAGQVRHHVSVLLQSLFLNYRNQITRPKIFIHFREPWFDLIVLEPHKLVYANMFEFKQAEDMVYYLLFAIEQLGMHADRSEAVLLGRISRNTPVYNLIARYIRKMEFAQRNPAWQYSFVFNEIPPHTYYPLINLNQCGL
jgi:hypothetical protein